LRLPVWWSVWVSTALETMLRRSLVARNAAEAMLEVMAEEGEWLAGALKSSEPRFSIMVQTLGCCDGRPPHAKPDFKRDGWGPMTKPVVKPKQETMKL
jgi:hypothetical protein